MVDLTQILVFGRLLMVDSHIYPVQQPWFQHSQKRNIQNVNRFPSYARIGWACVTSHHTPVYSTSCFHREPVEHSIEQQRALLPVMPIYGIASLLNGRKTRWMKWLLEIVFEGICQNKDAKRAIEARCIRWLIPCLPDNLTFSEMFLAVLGVLWHLKKKRKNKSRPTDPSKKSGERAIQHIFF